MDETRGPDIRAIGQYAAQEALWAEFRRYPQANPNHWAAIATDAVLAAFDANGIYLCGKYETINLSPHVYVPLSRASHTP